MNFTPSSAAMTDPYEYDYYDNATYDYDNSTLLFNSTLTEWCEAGEYELAIKVFQSCIFFLVFWLGVVGNFLVIATFALYRRRLSVRSMTDVFLFHLALADLLLLFTLPLQAIDTHLGWIFTDPLCKATRACYAINTYSGLLLLACISIDRYVVVTRAQKALRHNNQMLTAGKLVCLGVWLIALFLSLPEILFSGVSGSGIDAYCGLQKGGQVKMATYGALIFIFSLSFLVMMLCYSAIGLVLCKGRRHGRGKVWQHQRTLKLMMLLVLVFLVFQLPYTVVLARKMAGHFCGPVWEYMTCTLAYTRCCLNPILYALVGVRFRSDILKFLHNAGCLCGFHLGPQPESCTSMSPSSPAVTSVSAFSPTTSLHGPSGNRGEPISKSHPDLNHSRVGNDAVEQPRSFLFQRIN